MHNLNITHSDIKPENIVYSPNLKKLIFIDFGMSSYNPQKIG
jgi:serine/threonine protein kinase